MALAKRMILSAKECGAGLVKSQLYNAEDDKGKPNYDLIKKAELTFDQAREIFDYGESIGIEVFFSVFGEKYVEWCEKIGVKRYKLACNYGDVKTIRAVRATGKPLFESVHYPICPPTDGGRISWLYCIPDYPALPKQFFFDKIDFKAFAGLSDHSIGIDVAKIAIARGAQIIEKHFILDRNSPAPDVPWSMTPDELAELVRFEKMVQECL